MNIEKTPVNRLIEDKNFYNQILGKILFELEELSRIYDNQTARSRYMTSWKDKIDKIKTGEKLGVEPAVENIILDVTHKSGLSSAEISFLFNSLFKPRKQRADED